MKHTIANRTDRSITWYYFVNSNRSRSDWFPDDYDDDVAALWKTMPVGQIVDDDVDADGDKTVVHDTHNCPNWSMWLMRRYHWTMPLSYHLGDFVKDDCHDRYSLTVD